MCDRTIKRIVESVEQSEGMGARVRRSIGRPELKNFDPFLMLDEFKVALPHGFPDHPHRGFETVTYVLDGAVKHEDFKGNSGIIGVGDLQWMTAGRGIVHCEMPAPAVQGLQLWVNLAGAEKMSVEPGYQDLKSADIPTGETDGGAVKVRVIAGESMGIKSPIRTRTPVYYLDFTMLAADEQLVSKFSQRIPPGWNAFIYTLTGNLTIGDRTVIKPHDTVTFNQDGDQISFRNQDTTDETCRFVLIAGKPLNEPVCQHGPFVMNTDGEIREALADYRSGRNGFDMAPKWKSSYAMENNED